MPSQCALEVRYQPRGHLGPEDLAGCLADDGIGRETERLRILGVDEPVTQVRSDFRDERGHRVGQHPKALSGAQRLQALAVALLAHERH